MQNKQERTNKTIKTNKNKRTLETAPAKLLAAPKIVTFFSQSTQLRVGRGFRRRAFKKCRARLFWAGSLMYWMEQARFFDDIESCLKAFLII